MKIMISAESTIDLPKELLAEFKISTIPFMVILGENEYKDGEITPKDIFEFVDKNKILPKTAAINEEQYKDYFQELLKESDAVVHICLSSEISSACAHAKEAEKLFKNVYVVDSKSLSTGIALLAIYARKLADQGVEPKEIAKKLEERVPFIQASFVVKKLDYLYKGGRCSAVSYFGANIFQIRPQILLKDGKMGVHKKYRGNMGKVIETYCKDALEEFNNPDLSVAFLTYTTATQEMISAAKTALQEKGFKTIYETQAGATITSHCGEETLGILYFNDGEKE
ncbi:MAG: DegV family protein [Clostridiales bacterium]|nr:DegV family protein [Clostridiales bacterium]